MRVHSAAELTTSRDCVAPLCVDVALAGLEHCQRHASIADIRAARKNGHQADGLAALEAMDAGEPQRLVTPPTPRVEMDIPRDIPDAKLTANGSTEPEREAVSMDTPVLGKDGRRRVPWALPEILEAFRAFHVEHGRWPLVSDAKGNQALPSSRGPESLGLTWQDIWDRLDAGKVPTGAGALKYLGRSAAARKKQKRSGRAAERKDTAAVETPIPSPDPPATSRDLEPLGKGNTTEATARPDDLRATELAQINADRRKVDAYLASQEPPAESESYSESNGGGFTLALTGDFTRDAEQVRQEAQLLRRQADALEEIATGIDKLAETVG